MSLMERFELLSGRFYDAIRSDKANEAAAIEPTTATGFDHLRGHTYALLATYRRSGEPVATPVWFGLDDAGRVYTRSGAQAAKLKRISHDPRARVAPCTMRGKPLGPFADGTARIVSASEEEHAEAALEANYGLGRKLYEGGAGSAPAHYIEVTPADVAGAPA